MLDTAPAVRRPPGRRSSGRARPRRRPHLGPYLLIAPTVAVIAVLMFWPMIQIGIMSFQKVGNRQLRGEPAEQVGTENFEKILGDPFFWQTVKHTVLFAVVAVSLTLVVGTLVGLLLNKLGKRMSAFVAGGVMIAWATPPVTAAIIFSWLFGSTGGLVNWPSTCCPTPSSAAAGATTTGSRRRCPPTPSSPCASCGRRARSSPCRSWRG